MTPKCNSVVYRVELSEIARTLEELPEVTQCVVVSQKVKRDSGPSQLLVAYVVTDKSEEEAGNEPVTEGPDESPSAGEAPFVHGALGLCEIGVAPTYGPRQT